MFADSSALSAHSRMSSNCIALTESSATLFAYTTHRIPEDLSLAESGSQELDETRVCDWIAGLNATIRCHCTAWMDCKVNHL